MRFGLNRKPGAELSCRPRSPKKSSKDIYTKMDSYYRQKAKSYPCARIIEFHPKPVRGVQGELDVATRDQGSLELVKEEQIQEEPDLLKTLKNSSADVKLHCTEACVADLLKYYGYRKWCGNYVIETRQNVYKVLEHPVQAYDDIVERLEKEPGVIEKNRRQLEGKTLLKSLITNNGIQKRLMLEDRFLKDDRETCYLPFKNDVVKITKDGVTHLSYSQIPGWVWEHNIIDHNIKPDSQLGGDWWEFLIRTCSKRGEDGPVVGSFEEERFEALLCAIGYNIHRYKSPSRPALTIFSDEYNGTKNDGGTGKSIICKSIGHMNRKFNREDGKSITRDNRFNFAELDGTTDIAYIDDLDCRTFRLQELYAKVTDDITVEPKGKPKKTIPYELAPKWLINTNDISQIGTNGSDQRRRMDIQLKHYYGNGHQPKDDFGKEFWREDWTDEDWNQFYHVQIQAVKKSLEHNVAENGLPAYDNTIIEDSMRQEISEELIAIFEERLKDRIEAGGEIRISNEELNEWVDGMNLKDIKSKLVKYHQLELEDKYDLQCDACFKLPGDNKTYRGIKLIPKQQILSIPVSPRRS